MASSILTACRTADDALIVAEALSAQIEAHRNTLDHRSLFSAAFNRKLVKKIELLDLIRQCFLEYAGELRINAVTQQAHDKALIDGKAT